MLEEHLSRTRIIGIQHAVPLQHDSGAQYSADQASNAVLTGLPQVLEGSVERIAPDEHGDVTPHGNDGRQIAGLPHMRVPNSIGHIKVVGTEIGIPC